MRPLIRFVVIVSTLLTTRGCYTESQYPAYADDGSADLVEVSPGVEVIADWNEPIFFADDYYWAYRGGFWYRSGWHGGGWVRAGVVPVRVRGIAHPGGYIHYRPGGFVRHEPVRGGYASHAHYHATHAGPPSVHVRPAGPSGGRHH